MKALLGKLKRELEIRNSSKKTVSGYIYSVGVFLEFAEKEGLNEEVVKNYVQRCLKNKSPSSVRKDLFAIKFFFDAVLKQPLNMPNPKKNKTLPDILTPEEVGRMIGSLNSVKHKLIVQLLYGCGLRVSEVTYLNREDVNFDEGLIHIRLAKGKKDRFVKIPESLVNGLKHYCEPSDKKILFDSNRGGKLTTATIQAILKKAGKKAGIKKRVYPHLLRHSFATHLLDNGTDIRIIQKLLGHSDVKTTQIYLQVSNQSIKNVRSPLDCL